MSKPVLLSIGNGKVQELVGTANNDVLTWNGTLNQWQSSPGGGIGTVTQVDTGTGLTGGPITGSGTISLAALSPAPTGTFTNATVTVDAYGRVTSASSGSIAFAQEYFVALNGNDTTGNGSLSAPYATIGKAVAVANAVAGDSFLKINVAPGTYLESFTVSRRNVLIEGAGTQAEEFFTKILGTVTVDSTSCTEAFTQQIGLTGLFISSSTTSPAVRFTGTGTVMLVVEGSYLYATNAAANVLWCDSTAATRSVCILRNSIVLHQASSASASIVKLSYGDVRFDTVRVYSSGSSSTGYGVEVANSATLIADRALIDVTTSTAAVFGSGTSTSVKLLISNSSVTNRGNNANSHAISATNGSLPSGNIAGYLWQVLLSTFTASAKTINGTAGTSGVYYGALSFGPNASGVINSSIATGVTLLPLTEKLGNLDAPLSSTNGGTGLGAPVSGDAGKVLAATAGGGYELQTISGDATLASSGAATVTGLQTNPVAAGSLGLPDAGKALIWSGSAWQAAPIPGGGSGTVTSVGLTGGTSGIVIGGTASPITTSGTFNLDAPLRFAFNTATPTAVAAAGQVSYNTDEGSLEQMFDGGHVKSVLGQTLHQRVLNDTGSTLTKGQVVYVSGAQGNRVTVALAQANADSTSATIIGLVAYAIADAAEGYVITEGLIKGVNTNGFTEGLPVYLSPTTPGALTQTKPTAPQHLVLVGYCVRADATVGEILVKTQNGYEIEELHDVYVNNPQSGQLLIYDATAGQTRWENASLTAGTNVTITNGAGSVTIAASSPYDLSGEFVGTPASGATIMRFVAARAFTFGGTAYFACTSNTGATTAVFTVNVNGVSKGTVSIAGNATSGTGTITSTSIAAGDLVSVVATTPANVVNPYWTLPGTV